MKRKYYGPVAKTEFIETEDILTFSGGDVPTEIGEAKEFEWGDLIVSDKP